MPIRYNQIHVFIKDATDFSFYTYIFEEYTEKQKILRNFFMHQYSLNRKSVVRSYVFIDFYRSYVDWRMEIISRTITVVEFKYKNINPDR